MTKFTTRQVAEAAAILRAIDADERRIENLGSLIQAAKTVAATNERAHSDATDFWRNPDGLANLIPMLRRNPRHTVNHAVIRYHNFISELTHPLLPGPPRKIDMNALRADARPYLLAPYLNLTIGGVYPRLCVETSDPARGILVYLTTGGHADPAAWTPNLAKVGQWLGGHWAITAHTATSVTLTRRTPLPPSLPFNPAWLKRDHLFMGIDTATQRPAYAAFRDLSHMLITGTVGMGKSVAMASIMRSILHSMPSIHRVYAIDPGGIAFSRYRGLSPKITTLSKPDDFAAVAANLFDLMNRREDQLGPSGREKFTSDYVFVIVDEWPAYGSADGTDKQSKAAHQQFMKHILALAKRGRKSGIRLIFTVQSPTETDIAPNLRAALPGVLAFRTPLQAHASALFGEITTLAADPRTLPRGQALYRDGTTGDITHVQFPLILAPGASS